MQRRLVITGLLLASGFRPTWAQSSWPNSNRPVRLIVPFAAGGSSDVMARGLGKQLSEQLGVPFVIENRPGAGGGVAMEVVAMAPADGYTLLYGTIGSNGVAPLLFKNLPINPERDLQPISLLARNPSVLIVHSGLPIYTLSDLINYAKANPGVLTYASAGNGSISHLAAELLKTMAGISMVHIPYRGGGAASADLLAGNVSLMIETITNAMSLTKTGKVRAIANSGTKRSSSAPDLPTFAEAGLPGYSVDSWTGLFTTRGTPRNVIDRLSSEVEKASHEPSYQTAMSAIGVEATSSSPEAFSNFVHDELMKWKRVIDKTGIRVD